ncbi:hypothetical protein [Piscirickettsia litoralis]|nr:hypothetical protein [Piscirickettsia litoralis]
MPGPGGKGDHYHNERIKYLKDLNDTAQLETIRKNRDVMYFDGVGFETNYQGLPHDGDYYPGVQVVHDHAVWWLKHNSGKSVLIVWRQDSMTQLVKSFNSKNHKSASRWYAVYVLKKENAYKADYYHEKFQLTNGEEVNDLDANKNYKRVQKESIVPGEVQRLLTDF